MKNKTLWIAVGGLVLAAACLLAYAIRPQAAAVAKNGSIDEMRKVVKAHMQKVGSGAKAGERPRRAGKGRVLQRALFDHLPAEERKLCEALQEAVDADNLEKTLQAVAKMVSCTNAEVRAHAVDALGWFGASALPELTLLMGDRDEDVAQSAINAWEVSVMEIDDAGTRLKVSEMALQAISNKDALQFIGSQFSIAATELIDGAEDEDAASDRRVKVVQSVVDMIDSPNAQLSEVGRGLYEEITGNEWLGVEEAEKYLADPDNYEPPSETAGEGAESKDGQSGTET